MKEALILLCSIVTVFIIKEKSYKRFVWFLFGVSFFSMDIIISESPKINSHVLFIFGYFVSLIMHKELNKSWKEFPLHILLFILLITHLMVGIMDERLNTISQFSRPIFIYAQTYFCLFIGYTSLKNNQEFSKILKIILLIFGIVSIYGIFTFFLQNNPYYDSVEQLFSLKNEKGMWSEVQERGYRVCSFLNNPIPYGFVMGFIAMLVISQQQKKINIISLVFLLSICVNVILSNSRSSFLTFLILIVVYNVLSIRYSSSIRFFIAMSSGAALVILLYFFVPSFSNSIDNLLDLVSNGGRGDKLNGTSINLKMEQWLASLYFFQQNPVWGNGYYYFNENIYSNMASSKGASLYGLEGYLFRMMVEEGIVQIIAVFMFFWSLFVFLLKKWTPSNNRIVAFSISTLVAFLIFILSVGSYGNVFVFTFLLLGVIIKYIELN